jgi:NTE family protein
MASSKTQRALVLQGGVAIGAYEAGIFKGLYDRLYKSGESLFDIVVGTSIGAINAAILVSHFTQNDKKSWEDSYKTLQSFWQHVGSPTPVSGIAGEYWLGEAGRRYYSTKEFFITGIDKVFDAPEQVLDYRFHDYYLYFFGLPNTTVNTRHRYNNERFRESIKAFAQFPIATTSDHDFDNKEEIVGPRLLTVAVDVLDGSTVTFDSYNYKGKRCLICWREFDRNDKLIEHVNSSHRGNIKDNKLRWSVYGQEGDNNDRGAIFYNEGIDLTHVMASGAFPTAFDYEKIDGRGFWDGGILSNTPLRELIQKHRDYWYKDLGEQEVPDLELYIVNVWPSKEATNQLPVDYDSLKDRKNDLTYHDKTGYDIKVAEMVNDYIDYINELSTVAEEAISSVQNAAKRKELTKRLEGIGRPDTKSSKKRAGDPKTREYKDLLDGRFKLAKVVKIERKDDIYNISNKWADFTSKTIAEMMKQGEDDAWKVQI